MNILFVVPYVPNKIRVRSYNWIRHLSRLGHRITLFTVCTSPHDHHALDDLRGFADQVFQVDLPAWRSLLNCLWALPSRQPLQAVYSWDESLADQLNSEVNKGNGKASYDLVHVEHLRGARYGLNLIPGRGDRSSRLPIVWDSVDSISLLFRQAMVQSNSLFSRGMTRFELGRTEEYEARIVDQFDRVLVTSKLDKEALLDLAQDKGGRENITVLPNGVDLDYFTPPMETERRRQVIVLSGKMSYHANVTMVVTFIEAIMPRVWSRMPGVEVWIVGKDPPPRIRAYTDRPEITVTGTVPDIRPYLRQATLSASPIPYGAGIQNKVLEAMACATPVVASEQAVSALNIHSDQDVMVASSHQDFAGKILTLLGSAGLRSEVGEAGRRYVEDNHDWVSITDQLVEVYSQALAKTRVGK